ncbi:hypothetical protein FLP10_06885 [Agromyces intestinalis]|uniref:Polysaccharide pyruvyl transferase family protein n=1 Tax=Agromyces intestinalis TaxID=2592652 RepID=A0A5C1YDP9_9MICO|nr:hypothetical protein [Agromyces intestinalis]QEO14174.1 hypothetical protein FLP10_06885 [Agromyces intestinalis]
MRSVFAVGRGQYENVGDIILRRQLLDWVRPDDGTLHVYVGASPDGYDEGLGLQPGDLVYRSFLAWYGAALRAAARGRAAYVFKPGEIQLTLVGMKEHLSVLPLLGVLRTRGGRAVRAGVGSRNFAAVPRALMRPSIALSDLTLWRDIRTAAYMRAGAPMPDLAFGEGAPDELVAEFADPDAATTAARDVLVVSLRADEPAPVYPSEAWLAGVRAYAERHGLEIWAVTQVHVDNERSLRLAGDLGGRALTWDALRDHDRQEARLRELYRRTAIALSDRLHVVIAAYTEGAVPVGTLADASDKIDRHFATIGVDGVTIRSDATDASEVTTALDGLAARRTELFDALASARIELGLVRERVQSTLAEVRA